MKVVVASENPVKVQAAKKGLTKIFPDTPFEFISTKIQSNVSDQPKTNKETLQGAHNRANNAAEKHPDADLWVGMEGGIEDTEDHMHSFAWIVIKSKTRTGRARTGTFLLPPKIAELIRGGMELGDADNKVFNREHTKHKQGAVGILTHNHVDRASLYAHAVILAAIAIKNPDLF